MLDNIVCHYKNEHQSCLQESRCRRDSQYQASKFIITCPHAESLLVKFIRGLNLYKRPDRYKDCKDTAYVESFNRAIKLYHSKDVHFSDEEYNMRTQLAILCWNENVDRPYTSITHENTSKAKRCRKVLKPKTYKFRDMLWKKFALCKKSVHYFFY